MSSEATKTTVSKDVQAGDANYLMHTYGRLPVEFVSGKGALLFDSEGNEYIDLLAGIGVVCLGHCHPKMVETLKNQAAKLWQVGNYYYIENRNELAKSISDLLSTTTDAEGHITGSTGDTWRSFFTNSGAESNEGAIKLARRYGEAKLGGATGIITAKKSFHGRTLAALAATGQDVFHQSFLPLPQGFMSVPLNDIDSLVEAVANPEPGCGAVCAVMLEYVQGEGGVWPADPAYLQAVSKLCHERGLLLMIDEVQTGFFRCGAPFSYQLAGIVPDIVSMAKGIGAGFPMGAFAARDEVADLMAPGDHGSTFGGNALASACGRAAIETLIEEGIGEHVIACGAHMQQVLSELPHVVDVRGHGLMRAIELDVPIANDLVEEGLACGLVLNHIGDNILRFLPPLVITTEQIDTMADRLRQLIERLA